MTKLKAFDELLGKAKSAVASVLPPVSPLQPPNPMRDPMGAARSAVAATAGAIANQLPNYGAAALRSSPAGQLYTQLQGYNNPSMQRDIQSTRLSDAYRLSQAFGLATNPLGSLAGGAANVALQGAGNLISGKPVFANYDQTFAQGVMGTAAGAPLSRFNPLFSNVVKGKYLGLPSNYSIPARAAANAVREGVEGFAMGALDPEAQNDRLGNAVRQGVVSGMAGFGTKMAGDLGSVGRYKLGGAVREAMSTQKYHARSGLKARTDGTDSMYLPGSGVPRTRDIDTRGFVKTASRMGKIPELVVEPRSSSGKSSQAGTSKMAGTQGQAQIPPQSQTQGAANRFVSVNQGVDGFSGKGSRKANISPSVQVGQEVSARLPAQQDSSSRIIAQGGNPSDPYFNVQKLNVDTKTKQRVATVISEVKPAIEKVVGKKLTNDEVVRAANNTARTLRKVVAREDTLKWEASLLRTRQKLAAMSQSGRVDQEYVNTLMALKSNASDVARKLQSFSIGADPQEITSKQAILTAVLDVEKDTAKVLAAAKGVDFNDYEQSVAFYRSFIKPTLNEKLDLLRYNSMLSSPNTHINNAFSNAINTAVIAPIEKTITGTLDFLASPFRGGERHALAGEGIKYAQGYWGKIGEASHRFADVLSGKSMSQNPDTRNIPVAVGGKKGALVKTLAFPMKMLEASDQFFTALTEGGEKAALEYRASKGIKLGNTVDALAQKSAAYRLFRAELNESGQGVLLDGIDRVTGLIQRARNNKNPMVSGISKFTLPFIRTPMNVLKQMIEYSPAGFATIVGASNKTEQLSKAILGTSAAIGTAMLVQSGRTTWAEPTDPKKKAAFRAAGMQPYSVKIGNHWVSYAKLPPALAANLALVSAIHDGIENKRLDDSDVDSILSGVAKWGNFFADQSYVKQIGDLVSTAKGDAESWQRYLANYPQQLVPFRALMGWVARVIDPYQRKVNADSGFIEQQMQQLMTNIPGLSMNVPARVDQNGAPIENQNRLVNAVSPMRVTTEKPEARAQFDTLMQKSRETKLENDLKKRVEQSRGVEEYGNKVAFMDDNGETRVVDMDFQPEAPTLTGEAELDKKLMSKYTSQITQKEKDVVDLFKAGKLTQTEAEKLLTDLKGLKAKYAKPKTPKIKTSKIRLSDVRMRQKKFTLGSSKVRALSRTKRKNRVTLKT